VGPFAYLAAPGKPPLLVWAQKRLLRLKLTAILVYHTAATVQLYLSGYPVWRVGAVGFIFTGAICHHRAISACAARGRLTNSALPPMQVVVTAAMTACYALTGGLASPLLVGYLTPMVTTLVMFGGGREARLSALAIALGTLVLALLPASVRGPQVSQPWAMLLSATTIAFSLTILWLSLTALMEAYRSSDLQLQRTREEMASAAFARARSLEQIGAKVAHELKNPLAAIKGLVQLMARGQLARGDGREGARLAVVESEVTRMESILREYLSFSRPLEELEPQAIELGKLADEVLAVLEARSQSAGVTTRARGNATVRGDPRRLKEAMLNLVANALEATPPGGEVAVEVRESQHGALIEVRDTGRGMPHEVLVRVGTPFFTTRSAGTGLGVTLARAAFVQHGGELRYESAPGKGTTAIATVPRICRGAQKEPSVQSPAG
jgi:signal transduction histidine kinase